MGIHAAHIARSHRLIESVPGLSEPVRVGLHRWVSHVQLIGRADQLTCLTKKTLLAIRDAVSGNMLSSIHHIVPVCSDVLIREIRNAVCQYELMHVPI